MAAVDAGVHVHFNKSMTTTVDEANRLIAAAQAKGVKLVSSPGEMLRPRHQKIKQLLADGAILHVITQGQVRRETRHQRSRRE